jgi:4-amino-4-deoxy-L-arabinose transferase-like glycosyltransferase
MSRPPRLVLVATAAFGILTAFWSVLTPLTEAPDEPAHLGLVLEVADTGHYPAYDGLQHTAGLFQLCVDYATSANWCRTDAERATGLVERERPADEAPAKHGRVRWDDPEFRRLKPGRLNQMPQHPPLYYAAMAGALRIERAVVPGSLSVDTELAFLRLLNVLIVLPLPWLAWLAARRLRLGAEVAVVAALVPLAVPQLTHIGGTLNNDNLFVVLASGLMALLAGVVQGDRSRRTLLLVGVVAGLALLTKGFGVVLPPVVLLAYLVGSRTPRTPFGPFGLAGLRWWRDWRAVVPAVGALAVGFVVSGWWYLGNLAATGQIMPSIEDQRLSARNRPPGFHPRLGEYAASAASRLVEGFWGAFGWRRVELPTVVSVAATVLCVGAAAVAFVRPPVARPKLAVLLAPVALLVTFVLVRSAVIYRDSGRLAFQQGRYLFAGLTAAAAVVAVGAVRLLGARAVRATVAGVLVLQGLAVAWCLNGWWGTDGVPVGSLRAVVAWSGWPDPVVVVFLVMAPLALAALVHAAWRHIGDAAVPVPVDQPTVTDGSALPGQPVSAAPGPRP